jgi:hypothetical protein
LYSIANEPLNPNEQAMRDAGTIAGIAVLRIINEPTSIAIAHDLDQQVRSTYKQKCLYSAFLLMDTERGTSNCYC